MKRCVVLCLVAFACGPDQGGRDPVRPRDGGLDFSGFGVQCTHPPKDSDGDTILDKHEGTVDTDGDLIPNYRDLDSDGDCVPDSAEAGDADPMTPPVDS